MSDSMEYIKEFITKMNTQDNRGTCSPFYYTIRDFEYVSSYHEGEGDRVTIVYDTEQYAGDTAIQAFDYFVEHGHAEDFEGDREDVYEIKEYLENLEHCSGIFWENKKEVFKGVFFTETDAKEHLRLNHYHYSIQAHTYVDHAWRAPELKKFFECVGEVCGVHLKRR